MRNIGFKYKLLHKDNTFKKWLGTITSCNVRYDSLSTLKSSARIGMKEDLEIDYYNDRIQPIVALNGLDYPLGVFLISSPKRKKGLVTTRDIDMYSTLQLVAEDILEERFYIGEGENVVNTIIRLIGIPCDITLSTKTTLTGREYEIGTSKIEIINELLKSINYTSLYVDMQGKYIARPYVLPMNRAIDIEYLEGVRSILVPSMDIEFDTFGVPNRFIRYTNHPDVYPPLVAIYENTNVDSPISTANRRVVPNAREVTDVTDLETLIALTKKECYEATDVFEHLIFESAINPVHGYSDCIYVRNEDIFGKFIETSWEFNFQVGAKMKHEVRRVITI